ncbi:hypothetical protein A176_007644 [Myxococcus hansupus]|uniref:Uncharacterized protein n=1 Tax=Pseudomyxococcus hansupus TaxID=1297742 RepID=A0A0H4XQT1_9BACT|nr:hypothetical protein A176_007644 [Myxococcus hansupus]
MTRQRERPMPTDVILGVVVVGPGLRWQGGTREEAFHAC